MNFVRSRVGLALLSVLVAVAATVVLSSVTYLIVRVARRSVNRTSLPAVTAPESPTRADRRTPSRQRILGTYRLVRESRAYPATQPTPIALDDETHTLTLLADGTYSYEERTPSYMYGQQSQAERRVITDRYTLEDGQITLHRLLFRDR